MKLINYKSMKLSDRSIYGLHGKGHRGRFSLYGLITYCGASSKWIKSRFFFRYSFINFLHTNTQINKTHTWMFFIAKWEKLYNLELLILFNWTNDRKNQLLHIKITSTGLKKNTHWELSNHTIDQLTFYLINSWSLPFLYMDKNVHA